MVNFSNDIFPDSRCFIIYDEAYLKHRTGNHPEHPQRLNAIKKKLESADFAHQLDWKNPRKADETELRRVHTRKHIDLVRSACMRADDGYVRLDMDTVVCGDSYEAALYAVGGLEVAIDLALGTGFSSAFALVRPPGHHALPERSMGFCLFNNIAIGADYAVQHHKLDRVLIIDWDLHHGNGTQEIFWSNPNIFYISTHQGQHYPGTGYPGEIGEGPGLGRNLNIPLPAGSGDNAFSYCFTELIGPVTMAFKPELILVSAGYDAHCDDPLGLLKVTEGEYGRLSYYIRCLSRELGARLVFTLEGGYDLEGLANSVVETIHSLVLVKPDEHYLPHSFLVADDLKGIVAEQKERMGEFWELES